jgi:translation elongation factor EF-Ts
VLVQMRGGDQQLARRLAMHIAASAPQWIGREDVPEKP